MSADDRRLSVWCVVAQAPKRLGGQRKVLRAVGTRSQARAERYNLRGIYPYSRLLVRRFEETYAR